MVLTWITDAAPGEDRGRPPLVVMPSMFGAVAEWRAFFRGLDVDRPVFGLELLSAASYWTDEPTMQEIAARCVEVLLRDLSSRRLHLIGHSFGGRLAYKLGQQLEAAGRPPGSIVIVDTPTTGAPRRLRWRDLRSMVANAPGWMKNELQIYGAAALAQPNPEPLAIPRAGPRTWSRRDLRRLAVSGRISTSTVRQPPRLYRVSSAADRQSRGVPAQPRPIAHPLSSAGWRLGRTRAGAAPDRLADSGDHGSVLYPQWREDVASAIQQALEQGDRY